MSQNLGPINHQTTSNGATLIQFGGSTNQTLPQAQQLQQLQQLQAQQLQQLQLQQLQQAQQIRIQQQNGQTQQIIIQQQPQQARQQQIILQPNQIPTELHQASQEQIQQLIRQQQLQQQIQQQQLLQQQKIRQQQIQEELRQANLRQQTEQTINTLQNNQSLSIIPTGPTVVPDQTVEMSVSITEKKKPPEVDHNVTDAMKQIEEFRRKRLMEDDTIITSSGENEPAATDGSVARILKLNGQLKHSGPSTNSPRQYNRMQSRPPAMPKLLDDEDDGLTCRLCLQPFWYKHELDEHLTQEHSISNPRNYEMEERQKKLRRLKEEHQRHQAAKHQRAMQNGLMMRNKGAPNGTAQNSPPNPNRPKDPNNPNPKPAPAGPKPSFQYRDGVFICDLCKKNFSDGNDMVAHWKSHVKQQARTMRGLPPEGSPTNQSNDKSKDSSDLPTQSVESKDPNAPKPKGKPGRPKGYSPTGEKPTKPGAVSNEKESEEPKRLTARGLWSQRRKKEIMAEHPDWELPQITKIIKEGWKEVKPDEIECLKMEVEHLNLKNNKTFGRKPKEKETKQEEDDILSKLPKLESDSEDEKESEKKKEESNKSSDETKKKTDSASSNDQKEKNEKKKESSDKKLETKDDLDKFLDDFKMEQIEEAAKLDKILSEFKMESRKKPEDEKDSKPESPKKEKEEREESTESVPLNKNGNPIKRRNRRSKEQIEADKKKLADDKAANPEKYIDGRKKRGPKKKAEDEKDVDPELDELLDKDQLAKKRARKLLGVEAELLGMPDYNKKGSKKDNLNSSKDEEKTEETSKDTEEKVRKKPGRKPKSYYENNNEAPKKPVFSDVKIKQEKPDDVVTSKYFSNKESKPQTVISTSKPKTKDESNDNTSKKKPGRPKGSKNLPKESKNANKKATASDNNPSRSRSSSSSSDDDNNKKDDDLDTDAALEQYNAEADLADLGLADA